MITKNDIKALADLKNTIQQEQLEILPAIETALAKFDGKSITGNKKRITDALQNVCKLFVYIEYCQYTNTTTLKIQYCPEKRYITSESGNTLYIDISDFYIVWNSFKDNIFNMDELRQILEREDKYLCNSMERTRNTAEHIDEIKAKAEQLREELRKLQSESDNELTDYYNIRFMK